MKGKKTKLLLLLPATKRSRRMFPLLTAPCTGLTLNVRGLVERFFFSSRHNTEAGVTILCGFVVEYAVLRIFVVLKH